MGNALAGKVALVTGSARGMGEAEVRLFAAEGARVVVSDMLHDLGEAVARDIGEQAMYQPLDVRKEDSWEEAVDRVLVAWGRLDVLINNAGIFRYSLLLEHTVDDYLDVFRTNELGTFL